MALIRDHVGEYGGCGECGRKRQSGVSESAESGGWPCVSCLDNADVSPKAFMLLRVRDVVLESGAEDDLQVVILVKPVHE